MSTVIKVENLSKQYRLGGIGTGTISHDINRWWHKVRGKEDPYLVIGEENDRTAKGKSDYVWALRDVNFEVKQGEVLGVIGQNGAGKSTLLKILSKTTIPTTGYVKMKGRIASLLEVGTGFHPELSGRDNIFLNGAILGMTKKEIQRKFDEIVDFAGVERYIDTPVKRYSSGMYVRLAFAVAAHLEPEILIVDEVLAVGDVEFQKKCLGKMSEISKGEGRTILFVSHNMQAISTLTSKCILLANGNLVLNSDTSSAIVKYLSFNRTNNILYLANPLENKPSITKVEIKTSLSQNTQMNGQPMEVLFHVNTPYTLERAAISFQVINEADLAVMHVWNFDSDKSFCREKGTYELVCKIPKTRLYLGKYILRVHFGSSAKNEKFETIENICPFEVVMYGRDREYNWVPNTCTYIEDCQWEVNQLN